MQSFQWEGVLPEKSTLEKDPAVADNQTVSQFLNLASIARFQPLNLKSADIAAIVGEELAKAYSGEKDPQTALDDAAAKVNELLSYSATSW
jgi:multiple sugar transport system substrate-binding protein